MKATKAHASGATLGYGLSRSLKGRLQITEKIGEAGAGFRSLTEHIDTITPAEHMIMQMVGRLPSSNERCECTSAGLAAARAEGRIGGQRKKPEDTKRHEIAEAVISGRKTTAQMARMFGAPPPTVSRIVAARRAGL